MTAQLFADTAYGTQSSLALCDCLQCVTCHTLDCIAVGADVKDGKIAIKGWLETADLSLDEFLKKLINLGVKTVICTDISRDGAMKGTNLALY